MSEITKEKVLHSYLRNFEEQDKPLVLADLNNAKSTGEKIVSLLKKESLTYQDAYSGLQYAYDLLKYESNFVKIPD